jgi:hypothetical protein
LTPWSSVAVPVTVKDVLVWMPVGPVTEVAGVWSPKRNVSIFFVALVAVSFTPFVPIVHADTVITRVSGMFSGSVHVRFAPEPGFSVAVNE